MNVAGLFADLLVVLHLAFIVFVIFGGLLALRWRRMVWLHLPAVLWGALIEFVGWVCPLTPLENRLRAAAGEAGYVHSFIEHYVAPLVYPAGLTPHVQLYLGVGVIVVNLLVYAYVLRRSG
ncbi:MAG: DUF2784 domain-containing protein [Gammaproteobacteria bacterium]|nr:DUF2784 domain-containing protein [Gammaproteobacteria bacterium]